MTHVIAPKWLLIAFGTALLAAIVIGSWLQMPLLMFTPAVAVAFLLLLQKPLWLLYALLVAVPWSVAYNFSDTLATDLPDEFLMLAAAFAAVLLAVYNRRRILQKELHPLLLLLLLEVVWIIVAAVFSTNPLISFKFLLAKTWYVLAFAVLPLFLLDKNTILQTTIVLLAATLAAALLVMFRHTAMGFRFEDVNSAVSPFFRNHVNYSALLVCMVPVLFVFFKGQRTKRAKCLLALALMFVLAALYFSYARGAWLAVFTGAAGYWLLKKRWLVAGFCIGIIITVTTVFLLQQNSRFLKLAPNYNKTVFHANFAEHLLATYRMTDLSTAERYYRWIAGVKMAAEGRPTGVGPNTFFYNYKAYTIPAFKTWVSKNEERSTVHNYFLLLLTEQGATGLILFLLLVGFSFSYAERIYRRTQKKFWKSVSGAAASILVMIVTLNFLSDLIEADKVGSLFYWCIALLIVADVNTKNEAKL